MKFLITTIFLLISGLAIGQDPYYHSINKTSGIPSNSVYDIFQDSKGFMWFATGKGLCRYDGNTFKTFTDDFQTSKAGACLWEDPYGRIWYENFDGYLYYVEKGKLKTLPQPASAGYYNFGIIKNKLFAIKSGHLFIYDLKNLKVEKEIPLDLNEFRSSFCDGTTFYILGQKIYEFDRNGNKKATPLPQNTKDFEAPILQSTADGLLIASKYSSSYHLYKNGIFTKKTLPFKTDFIQNAASIENKHWLCTTGGVYRLNTKTNEYKAYFKGDNISYVFMDNQKNYWVSTLNKGLYFIENFDTKLYELSPRPIVLDASDSELFIGTDKDELWKMDLYKNKLSLFYKGNTSHSINQLTYDKNNNQLFFTSSKFRNFRKKIRYEFKVSIKDVARIDANYFSFAATGGSGIFKINDSGKSEWDEIFNRDKVETAPNFNQSYLLKKHNGKSTAYNPANKTIYYATNNGLITYSPKGSKEIKYNNKTIYFTKLRCFNTIIYAVSNNEKVYTIDKHNNIKPYRFPKSSLLPKTLQNEKIEKIDLENNALFLFSANAIYEANLITNRFKKIINLTQDIEITDVSLSNNKLYFAASKGIIVKEVNRYKAPVQPQLSINELVASENSFSPDSIPALKYNQNDIKINFSLLSFIPNEKYDVYYKVNDSKWDPLDPNSRSLILSSLSPGKYTVALKIGSENKKMNMQEIEFTIKNPLWLNPIVVILTSALLLFLLFSYYKKQIRKIEKRNQLQLDKINLEKNLNQSKLKAVKSQMNPHFFYNALNTIQSYILSNDKKQAVNYLSKFSSLTRTILEMTEKETVTISEEVKTLRLYLDIEKARFEDDFHYEIIVKDNVDSENIKIPSMLLQPYIENAVKHGLLHKSGKKILEITFEKTNDDLKISVDDNGIGRTKSAERNAVKNKNHRSFATKAIQNRVDLLNQFTQKNITISYIDKITPNNEPEGTTVIFTIPITH
ncbi:MAG TPA: histidine kinase [Flavobacterium sp.]|uniref:sensor histidine kinase n=1 Tax=Flavobacterium sp. TaxID=239 RepID=UPI002BD33253|nr:histidine kinase [Flavobacterium sp.]HSD13333.1 histidine kinase [Flavobacterium sp.]